MLKQRQLAHRHPASSGASYIYTGGSTGAASCPAASPGWVSPRACLPPGLLQHHWPPQAAAAHWGPGGDQLPGCCSTRAWPRSPLPWCHQQRGAPGRRDNQGDQEGDRQGIGAPQQCNCKLTMSSLVHPMGEAVTFWFGQSCSRRRRSTAWLAVQEGAQDCHRRNVHVHSCPKDNMV